MNTVYKYIAAIISILVLAGCMEKERQVLPILGHRSYDIATGDTVYHRISDFRFVNQDSQWVTNGSFKDKVYIVDFFFTSCPTICPKVKAQMLRIHNAFEDEGRVALLSHSIDTYRDSVPVLKAYSSKLNVDVSRWHFITGEKEIIYGMAEEYFIAAAEDPDAPGGFDHSGKLILVDKNRHIRSYCDGTKPKDVDRFIEDIKFLLETN